MSTDREMFAFMLDGKVTHEELDAAATAVGPPGQAFERRIMPDPGNPGGSDIWGGWRWPPDHRWETDAEFRERIKRSLSSGGG